MWWLRRGDAYRLLSSLARHLDGRTWPLEDTEEVGWVAGWLLGALGGWVAGWLDGWVRWHAGPAGQLEAQGLEAGGWLGCNGGYLLGWEPRS